MDKVQEQRKLEARKMLENGDKSRRPAHAVLGGVFIQHAIFLVILVEAKLESVPIVTTNYLKDDCVCLSSQELLLVISQSLLPIRPEYRLL